MHEVRVNLESEMDAIFIDLGVHPSSLVLILVSQSLPLVEQKRLTAFPLRLLIQMLVSVIATTFVDGEFLSQLSAAIVKEPNGLLGMPVCFAYYWSNFC